MISSSINKDSNYLEVFLSRFRLPKKIYLGTDTSYKNYIIDINNINLK